MGYLMCSIVREINFRDFEEGFTALATMVAMPFTYSMTNGIGAGFVAYAFIKLIRGRGRDLHPMLVVVSLAFVRYFFEPWLLRLLRP